MKWSGWKYAFTPIAYYYVQTDDRVVVIGEVR